MQNVSRRLATTVLCIATTSAYSITPLSDDELGDSTGSGIGLVLDNYALSVDSSSSWKIGIEGSAAELIFDGFWWMPNDGTLGSGCTTESITAGTGGTGSSSRCVSNYISKPGTGGSATIGRVSDPIRFDVTNKTTNKNSPGDTNQASTAYDSAGSAASRTVITLAAPESTLATDRMDASYLMTLDHGSNVATSYRYDATRVTTRGMDIDGSYISMWAEGGRLNYVGQINFRADEVNFVLNEDPNKPTTITATNQGYTNTINVYESTAKTAYGNFRIGSCLNDSYCDNDSALINFRRGARGVNTGSGAATTGGGVEFYYPMGRSFYQPISIGTESDGNLTIELKLLPNVYNVYKDFYENKAVGDNLGYTTPRGYVRLGSVTTNWDGKAQPGVFSANFGTTVNSTYTGNTLNQWQYKSYGCGFLNLSTCYWYNQVGPRRDFGYSRIEGIQLQYLKITTKGL